VLISTVTCLGLEGLPGVGGSARNLWRQPLDEPGAEPGVELRGPETTLRER
jgi:hypothetical protein